MRLIQFLETTYGYDTPIFLKDVRIGRKSKAAVKEAFYRATKQGYLTRDINGVYSLVKKDSQFPYTISFENILEQKFIYDRDFYPLFKELGIVGYYSGLTFLNQIGLSQQVPAILEITTNNTRSIKRYYRGAGRTAILRKSKTTVTFQNYKILQFLDMFSFVTLEEIKQNKELLVRYIKNNSLSKNQFSNYISLYKDSTLKKIVEGGLILAFVG